MGVSKLRRSGSRVLHLRLVSDQKELGDRAWPLGRNVAREEGCSKARRRGRRRVKKKRVVTRR